MIPSRRRNVPWGLQPRLPVFFSFRNSGFRKIGFCGGGKVVINPDGRIYPIIFLFIYDFDLD